MEKQLDAAADLQPVVANQKETRAFNATEQPMIDFIWFVRKLTSFRTTRNVTPRVWIYLTWKDRTERPTG
jgi:hypothetical protein